MSTPQTSSPIRVGYLASVSEEISGIYRRALPPGWVLIPSNGDADQPGFLDELPNFNYLIVSATQLKKEHVARAANLKMVHKVGVGYDDINVAALKERNIPLAVCPVGGTDSVAEHAVALTLASLKCITNLNAAIRAHEWPRWEYRSRLKQLGGRRLGIMGFGRIGQAAAERFLPFGCHVEVLTRTPPSQLSGILQHYQRQGALSFVTDIEGLFERCSIVSIHVPLTDVTRGIVTERLLEKLGPDGTLINTSRGSVIDQEALIRVLKDGRLGYAGLDVLEKEPAPADLELLTMENVVLTPHVGGGGSDVLERKAQFIVQNFMGFHETGTALEVVES